MSHGQNHHDTLEDYLLCIKLGGWNYDDVDEEVELASSADWTWQCNILNREE